MPDPYIVVRYGGVDNTPTLPVIDLQFLEGYPRDQNMVRVAKEALQQAQKLGLTSIVDEINDYLHPRSNKP